MEINHRVSINGDVDADFYAEVKRLGIELTISPLPGHRVGLVTFQMAESDPYWVTVRSLIELHGAADFIGTSFSPEEILSSEWNRLVPMHEWGYPQPEKQMQWKALTYAEQCPVCGAGYTQKAPFRLAKEPRLGRYNFFTLFWTYTLFCKHEVVAKLKSNGITGYEDWKAVLHAYNQPSTTVSQLVITEISAPGLFEGDKNKPEKCMACGITKYAHHRRGKLRYRKDALRSADFQLTREWFGSGGHAGFREMIVSNRLARLILAQGCRGVALKPIELV
jgi:hypothetical protein